MERPYALPAVFGDLAALVLGSALVTLITFGCSGPGLVRPDPSATAATQPSAENEPATAQGPVDLVPFADTPITPVAESLARIALQGLRGGPMDPVPVPTRRTVGTSVTEVDYARSIHGRPHDLEVLCFAFELELILKRGEPPDIDEGPTRWGSIRATLALSRNGLRLVELRPRAMEPSPEGGAIPVGFDGLDALISTLLNDVARGDLSRYELDEADRQLLDNDAVWARVEADYTNGQIDQLQQMVLGLPHVPLAVRLDDVSILVRDERAHLFSVGMDFDPRDGSYVLNTAPLMRVTQLWPPERARRGKAGRR